LSDDDVDDVDDDVDDGGDGGDGGGSSGVMTRIHSRPVEPHPHIFFLVA